MKKEQKSQKRLQKMVTITWTALNLAKWKSKAALDSNKLGKKTAIATRKTPLGSI